MANQPGSPNRVLVVDDERDIRDMLALVLDAQQLAHEDVAGGGEALERLGREEFGTVLLDLMMPAVDGFAVLSSLRATRPELLRRVIVLTGGSAELVRRVDKDVYRVLRKPVVLRELMDTVRSCLGQASEAS